jgi:hemolysin-activating ACP:hemolysin acyltransferase
LRRRRRPVFSRKSTDATEASHEKPAVSSSAAEEVSQEERRRRVAHAVRQSLAFSQIVSLLMQSPLYRHYAIADLEWLVIPPLAAGMFALAEAKAQADGPAFPVAAVLWASVSADVDKRLSENPIGPIRLRPDEWRSGEQMWVVAAVGDPRVTGGLLEQLRNTAFKERNVKARTAGQDGKVVVKAL